MTRGEPLELPGPGDGLAAGATAPRLGRLLADLAERV
jgi:hypothetical protein